MWCAKRCSKGVGNYLFGGAEAPPNFDLKLIAEKFVSRNVQSIFGQF